MDFCKIENNIYYLKNVYTKSYTKIIKNITFLMNKYGLKVFNFRICDRGNYFIKVGANLLYLIKHYWIKPNYKNDTYNQTYKIYKFIISQKINSNIKTKIFRIVSFYMHLYKEKLIKLLNGSALKYVSTLYFKNCHKGKIFKNYYKIKKIITIKKCYKNNHINIINYIL